MIFNGANFTLSFGDRICFDVIVVDDNEIEDQESYSFYVRPQSGSNTAQLHDYTHIIIVDNEGKF